MPRSRAAPRKVATLKDVAREAGVSIAAVSYSLHGGGTIGDEMRARVRDVAERIGYRPNRSAQAVRTGRSTSIGLLVPDLTNPYYPALAQSVERKARDADYTVVLLDASGLVANEDEAVRYLENHGVAGAIWCQTGAWVNHRADAFQIPIAVVGSPGQPFDNVTAHDAAGGRLAAEYLLSLGHRRIGVLSGASVPEGQDDRHIAFVRALKGKAEVVWDLKTPYSIDTDARVVDHLTQRSVTAVMCGNDLIAISVLRAARQLGIEVPRELSVVGFDDIPWAGIVTPALTTIRQPVSEMAAAAVNLLIDRIANPSRTARQVRFDVELIERDSAAPPPQ